MNEHRGEGTGVLLETVLDAVQEAVVVVDVDDRITALNASASSLFGREEGRGVGRRVRRLFADPDQAEQVLLGARAGGEQGRVEVAVRSRYPGSRSALVTASHVVGTGEAPGHTVLAFRDVTALRHAERAWARNEQFFRAVFHQGAVAMAVFDLGGTFVQVNEAMCDLVHLSRKELMSRTLSSLVVEEDHEPARSLFRRLRKAPGVTEGVQLRFEHPDGEVRWGELSVRRVEDPTLGRARVLGVVHDITQSKRVAAMRQEFVERVVAAQEEERQRVSRELHDGVGQVLSSLSVRLASLKEQLPATEGSRDRLDELLALAQAATAETSQMAHRLRPPALDGLGFMAAMEAMAADCHRNHGLAVAFHGRGLAAGRLSAAVETALYRIAQEALNNAARHAGAGSAEVLVDRSARMVRLIVEDDGAGFEALEASMGLGLKNIRERASLLGGVATIESSPGVGTSVYVDIPLEES